MNPLQANNLSRPSSELPLGDTAAQPLDAQGEGPLPDAPDQPSEEKSGGRRGLISSLFATAGGWLFAGQMSSWLASMLIHGSIAFALSLLIFIAPSTGPSLWLEGTVQSDQADSLDFDLSTLEDSGDSSDTSHDQAVTLPEVGTLGTNSLLAPPQLESFEEAATSQPSAFSIESIGDPLASQGGGVEGRRLQNRRALALGNGGTGASESAVEKGLAWLAAHQSEDGGWRFNLKLAPQCAGECRDSGIIDSTTASTGLALLCFLGAGYTQHEGPYQNVVADGLYYLSKKMVLTNHGGDLRDTSMLDKLGEAIPTFRKSGDMYSHGIATLALCEAYAMTHDPEIAQSAQQAVDFIVYAQHKQGGWRYEPREPGDTTVSGWQVTALKSALLGKLKVPREVWYRASDYFDSVQDDRGATYGYQSPSKMRRSTTIVGLFSRMILGWPRNHPPLIKGMNQIAKQLPHKNHMYFNYYATQALYHVGGTGWKRWNPRMRDYLVDTQATAGHEAGSWYFDEEWSDRGGRLYCTALSILTLEVYYRYMPMYRKAFVEEAP